MLQDDDDTSERYLAKLLDDVFEQMKRSGDLYEQWMSTDVACKADPGNVEHEAVRRRLVAYISALAGNRSYIARPSAIHNSAGNTYRV